MESDLRKAIDGGAVILTAHRRQARQIRFRYAIAKQSEKTAAWETPAVIGWEDWLVKVYLDVLWSGYSAPRTQRKLITPFQEHVLWERIIENSGEAQVDDLAGTAAKASQAWRLLQAYRLPNPGKAQPLTADVQAFANWMRRYFSRCREQVLIDHARVADSLAPALRAGAVPAPAALLLVGFDAFTPQQRLLLKTLEELGTKLDNYAGHKVEGTAQRISYADPAAEYEAAARWVRVILSNATVGNTAVLVPQLHTHRRMIERIFDDVLMPGSALPNSSYGGRPYNIAAGAPFHRYPLVHAGLDVCALALGSMRFDRFSSLLRNPFLRASQSEQPLRARFDAWLRVQNVARVPLHLLSDLMRKFSEQAGEGVDDSVTEAVFRGLTPVLAQAGSTLRASQWAELFAALLDVCGWPGDTPLHSAEFQTTERLRALLDELAGLDFLTSPMGAADAVAMLNRLARQVVFQPQTPDLAVQILAPEQARGLRFDHLWICGLHANAWPAPAHANPFIPLAWQREHKMPGASSAIQLEAADRLTRGLLRSAEQVMVSSPAVIDDHPLPVSPLVEHLPQVDPAKLALADVTDYRLAIRAGTQLETFVDRRGPPLASYELQNRIRGGSTIFARQAQCPFRAFGELRLGAQPLCEPVPGLTPQERGALVHAALERVWQRLGSSDVLVTLLNGEYLELQLYELTDMALALADRRRALPLAEGLREMERQRLIRLLKEWLQLEAKRQPFDVVHAETDLDTTIGQLQIRLKIDRVDRLRSGGLAVIDYKTGDNKTTQWFGERLAEPQLPLYALAQKEDVAVVAFARVRPRASTFIGLSREPDLLDGVGDIARDRKAKKLDLDWPGLFGYWRTNLAALADGYATGHADVDPLPTACRYCHLGSLCRVNEQPGADYEALDD